MLGRVYCDLKPDPIEIKFGCLKPDPTRKIESVIRSDFRVSGQVSGWTFFYFLFLFLLLLVKREVRVAIGSSLVQLLDTLFDCLDFPILA